MKLRSIFASAIVSVFISSGAIAAENKITHRVFTVAATNDEWTQTNIKVSPGDILITNEPGNKIIVSKLLGEVGANGIGNGVVALERKLRAVASGTETDIGALFMKIGVGASIKIGAHSYTKANESGVVKLRVYDSDYSDNSGIFTVDIIHIPGSLIPPP